MIYFCSSRVILVSTVLISPLLWMVEQQQWGLFGPVFAVNHTTNRFLDKHQWVVLKISAGAIASSGWTGQEFFIFLSFKVVFNLVKNNLTIHACTREIVFGVCPWSEYIQENIRPRGEGGVPILLRPQNLKGTSCLNSQISSNKQSNQQIPGSYQRPNFIRSEGISSW